MGTTDSKLHDTALPAAAARPAAPGCDHQTDTLFKETAVNKPDNKRTPRPSTPPVEAPILVNRESGKVASVDDNRMKAIQLDVLDKKAKHPLVGIETLLEPDAVEAEQLERLRKHNDVVRKPLRGGKLLSAHLRELAEDDALWDAIREAYCDQYPNRQWPANNKHLSDWLQRQVRERGPLYEMFRSPRFFPLLDDENQDKPRLVHGERWWRNRMAARRKREQSLVCEIGETKSGSGDSLQS